MVVPRAGEMYWGSGPCGRSYPPARSERCQPTYEGVPRSCPLLSPARVTLRAVSCPHWLQMACSAVATAPQFGQTRYVCPFRMALSPCPVRMIMTTCSCIE
jgi:hypothetical protein